MKKKLESLQGWLLITPLLLGCLLFYAIPFILPSILSAFLLFFEKRFEITELACYTEDSGTRAVLQTGFRQPELAGSML